MIVLLILVCLNSNPKICGIKLADAYFTDASSCLEKAHSIALDWADKNPIWTVKSFKCQLESEHSI